MRIITDNKVKNIIENNLKSWFLDDEDVKSVIVKEVSQEYMQHEILRCEEKFTIEGKIYKIYRVWYYFGGKIIIEYCLLLCYLCFATSIPQAEYVFCPFDSRIVKGMLYFFNKAVNASISLLSGVLNGRFSMVFHGITLRL